MASIWGLDLGFVLEKLLLVLAVFGFTLGVAMYATLAERKFAAFFQDRIGPDRAGPFGLFQPLADGLKFFFKEEFIPKQADRFLFILGPAIAMTAACMTTAVIPWGYQIQIADFDFSLLFAFGVVSIGVYGIMIGGWASNNKFSLLSTIRASSQMISYEIAMGLSLIALVLVTGSLNIKEIVMQQSQGWHILSQPLGFLIFLICSFAETNRVPFDLAECETELVGGYHTEYSSMKLGFYLFAEYINLFVASAMISSLYFGGFNLPFAHLFPHSLWIGIGVFVIKIFLVMFFFIWVRWTIPRFRYDQLMSLGWKILMPLALLNLFGTAVVLLMKG